MLDLRPATRERFWRGWAPLREAPTGSLRAFVRDGARIVRGSLPSGLGQRAVALLAGMFSLHRRVEAAFLASGAAAQLADAALAGETTRQLAERICRIARDLSGATGAAVDLRSLAGLQRLGSDGRECASDLAALSLAEGRVEKSDRAAAVPLMLRGEPVGALSLRFRGEPGDLRTLEPLLSRAGAVLAAAERESRKDRFLSLAAHELKTPLTSIKGFSYSLARRLERGEPCDPRHVQVLERQAERLHSLLEEMLEVSRLETGRFVLHQEPCELGELVEASQRSLRRLGADDFDAEVEPALPLQADRERIERALTAMMLKARTLGPVRVVARRAGARAELRVEWSGAELAEADRARLLTPQWEASPAQRQGLGMALMVAQRAAELHRGTLRVQAQALVLHLPLRAPMLERDAGTQGRVLVVDDDEPIARMMAEFLAEHGFEADWAGGGRAALHKIRERPPDVLVLDLRMPDIDGREVLDKARGFGFSPRVVLFSADREVAAAARELRCEAFVEKPFAPESLLAAVRRAMAVGGSVGPA